jgi:MSHA type pilus biogenesis protein MshL
MSKQAGKILNFGLSFCILIFAFLISCLAQDIISQEAPITQTTSLQSGQQGKISLDIKGMDIVDVLKMLAQRSGMNIVIGKNVTGRVTMFLKDVDIMDAFEIILLANDSAYEKKGDIINIMTQRDYELLYGERYQDKKQAKVISLKYAKAADLSRALNQIKTNLGRVVADESSNTLALMDTPEKLKEMEDFIKSTDLPIQTRVFSLNYAQADKLQPKLLEAITKGVGAIRIDERTNKVVVTDFPEKLDEIAKIISAFDEKTPQVLINAQIIEIKPKDEFKMGVDWDYWLKNNLKLVSSMPTSGAVNKLSIGTAAKGTTITQAGDYRGIVDLLRTIGDTQILSSPRIAALNNQEAKILIGTKEVYVSQTTSQSGTGTEVTADQVNFVDVGIKLYVTPTINRDGFITMKIRPEVSSVKTTYKYGTPQKEIPVVETSEAETMVMIKDGVTIIIGGLRKDKKANTVDKIPVLGDIPLLGFLFRRTSNSYEKTELVILLTPHILTGAEPYTDFSEIKPEEGAVAKMIKGNIVTERIEKTTPKETTPKETTPKEKFSKDIATKDTTAKDITTKDIATGRDIASGYYKLVMEKLKGLTLSGRPKTEKGEIKLEFTLSKDGNLMGEPNILETNNTNLNPFAIKAIKDATPFPAFPQSLEEESKTFKISLTYE